MGVPAFFKWLSMACPKVVTPAMPPDEYRGSRYEDDRDGESGPPKIDCLYLDMNGIIHPCTHPTSDTDIPPPTSEADMWKNLEEYLDMVIEIVNPQSLIYMAIDGVAPRAKMNQQRGRRFRSAQEIYSGRARRRRLADLWEKEGFELPNHVIEHTSWDHNVITPGTKFMDSVSNVVKKYVIENLATNPKWANLKVIFSDANTPGEGEHKILDYIRRQRGQPGYNPNTKHCIYGADADLIMLSLSTHEPHFFIIREAITNNFNKKVREREAAAAQVRKEARLAKTGRRFTVEFNLINIGIVREFLENFYADARHAMKFKWDLENVIDDFVFLCFFGGNDFLPHLPALSIHQGGVDILMHLHKKMLPELGGYLTGNGQIDLKKIEAFMREFGKSEESILKQIEANQKELNLKNPRSAPVQLSDRLSSIIPDHEGNEKNGNSSRGISRGKIKFSDIKTEEQLKLEQKFKEELTMISKYEEDKVLEADESLYFVGAVNYKEHFYRSKFDCDALDAQDLRNKVRDYFVEGLMWNMAYYYQGCISWEWFYPYYYAPFPSDFVSIKQLQGTNFNMGEPFEPLQQLMAVLPPYSGHALPEPYRKLMLDPASEIIDFYPSNFHTDVKGKRFAWLGEVLLPLIEPDRLKGATTKLADTLTEDEKERNSLGHVYIFKRILKDDPNDDSVFGEIQGTFKHKKMSKITKDKELIRENDSLIRVCTYIAPEFEGHKCQLLKGVVLPKSTVRDIFDYEKRSKVSSQCISIVEHNLDRKSLREVKGLMPEEHPQPDDEELEELSKPTRRLKTE